MWPSDFPFGMKVLVFTTLYPDIMRPRHGIFVENRIRELAKFTDISIRVVAPRPWFPFTSSVFGEYGKVARAPRFDCRFGIPIYYPRYPLIPKIGMSFAPALMALWVARAMRRIIAETGDFDIIDAHYWFPDGVAAVMLGQYLRKPVTITARGSDLNVLTHYALPRRMIRWAADNAAGMATVSSSLRENLVRLGVSRDRVVVLRNGVDLQLFQTRDRATCRARFGLDGPTLVTVGNLVPIKGHRTIIEALVRLPGFRLLVVGDGSERENLKRLAASLSVADRVTFLQSMPQSELVDCYCAADALVLASRNEGWPNVLLEAMACGTPVVASDIPGVTEIIASPAAGRLFRQGDPVGLADAVLHLLKEPPSATAVRSYAAGFGWSTTAEGQRELFDTILQRISGSEAHLN